MAGGRKTLKRFPFLLLEVVGFSGFLFFSDGRIGWIVHWEL